MAYTPRPRPPTGIPAAPLILVSGPAKSGKSMAAYRLGGAPRIDKCWVFDLGEGSADEYAVIGGYEVLDWGRNWVDLADSIHWCIAQPAAAGKMNAVIVDSGSELWDALKDRATHRARNSKKNRAELAKDPDYEVDVSMPFWVDAKETWSRIVSPLKLAAQLVGVIVVRTDEVAEVVAGAPTNRKVVSLQCERSLPSIVTAHVQIRPDHSAHLIEVRSARVSVPPRGVPLGADNPLGELIDMLSPADVGFQGPDVCSPTDDERQAPPEELHARDLYDAVKRLTPDERAAVAAWAAAGHRRVTVPALRDSAALRAELAAKLTELETAAA